MKHHMPEIGSWGEEKYCLVRNYAQIFASSMKDKWHCRVYIDLFSGAGRAKIKDTGKIVDGSPLIALGIENPFDRYIFCEQNPENRASCKSTCKDLNNSFIHITYCNY